MNIEKMGHGLLEEEPQEKKAEEPKEKEESEEIKQSNIAHEYLQEHKNYQRLNESYQNTLRILDELRKEELLKKDDPTIKKLEGELKFISALMDGSQEYMENLFNQLSDESKEKYLKSEGPETK